MPAAKTPFYHYTGNSPYPPCHMQATMIVFDPDYAAAIKPSDLSIIKKMIKSNGKSNSNKEGFIGGMHGGFKEGLVTYNASGANNKDKDENTNKNTNKDTNKMRIRIRVELNKNKDQNGIKLQNLE